MFLAKIFYPIVHPLFFIKKLCFWIGFSILIFCFGLISLLGYFIYRLPDLEKMSFSQLENVARQSVLKKLNNKKKLYKWIPIKNINRDCIYTVVFAEDSTFYTHNGFNYDAIINAFAENFRQKRLAYGASTISQQVAKNLFLTSEKSFSRKIQEIFLTRDLEQYFTKNQIIEIYLNIAEFGPDIFGINAAAHYYLGKSPQDINAGEGAMLALMLPSPIKNHYSIYKNKNLSQKKKRKIKRILKEMLINEFISQDQYLSYLNFSFSPS